ncbi:alanine racemase [Marisediminicola antarctica]|uniref:alanine racemase n=1 Tax=Marisediminicola antarctica TaxID=674079 RepID=UPI00137AA488|nr:alanine racemase [Marisediminicola antarctica]
MDSIDASVLISTAALRHNVRLVRDRIAPAELMAVVKDDAYGHGLDSVLAVLLDEGVTRFGALDLPGALRVRHQAPDSMVFAWVFDRGDDLSEALQQQIDIGVTDVPVLERVAAAAAVAGTPPARIHLKLDTGLHRAGVLAGDWERFVNLAAELQRSGRVVVSGLWTHLAEESHDDDSRSIAEYREGLAIAEAHGIRAATRHIAASAAAYAREDARFDVVRVGAFLYGIAPGGGVGPEDLGLRPVMTLRAPIRHIRRAGERTLAAVGIGGASGILADAAGAVSVALAGSRYPVVAVEPTLLLIDVSGADATVGDTVTLFGDGSAGEPTLQNWADGMGTIGEEVVTRLSSLIPRTRID